MPSIFVQKVGRPLDDHWPDAADPRGELAIESQDALEIATQAGERVR